MFTLCVEFLNAKNTIYTEIILLVFLLRTSSFRLLQIFELCQTLFCCIWLQFENIFYRQEQIY